MDRLEANRKYDCFCGSGIAADFVAGYILEKHNLCFEYSAPFKVAIISDRQVSGYYYNIFENQFILRISSRALSYATHRKAERVSRPCLRLLLTLPIRDSDATTGLSRWAAAEL